MNLRRHVLEAATLVLAAAVCALVANALARAERKLPLFGTYPDALKVPEKKIEDSSKVNGAPALAVATPATEAGPKATAGAAAPAQLPIEEKRPRPTPAGAPKATAPPQGSVAKTPSSPADLVRRFPPHPDKPYVEVSGDDAAWLVARGVLVVDARRKKDYEQGHVAGARNISPWEGDADAKITALVNEGRDGAIPVVLYCSGGDCEDSHMLAQRIYGGGFNNLLVYRDGWPDWVRRGGKSGTGPEPAP